MTDTTKLDGIEALLPCPFCGSPEVEVGRTITHEYIVCCNCGCRTGVIYLGKSEATTAAKRNEMLTIWNTRAELPAIRKMQEDAARYHWLRDHSVPPHNFYLSVPDEFHGVRYQPADVDAYIDAARAVLNPKDQAE